MGNSMKSCFKLQSCSQVPPSLPNIQILEVNDDGMIRNEIDSSRSKERSPQSTRFSASQKEKADFTESELHQSTLNLSRTLSTFTIKEIPTSKYIEFQTLRRCAIHQIRRRLYAKSNDKIKEGTKKSSHKYQGALLEQKVESEETPFSIYSALKVDRICKLNNKNNYEQIFFVSNNIIKVFIKFKKKKNHFKKIIVNSKRRLANLNKLFLDYSSGDGFLFKFVQFVKLNQIGYLATNFFTNKIQFLLNSNYNFLDLHLKKFRLLKSLYFFSTMNSSSYISENYYKLLLLTIKSLKNIQNLRLDLPLKGLTHSQVEDISIQQSDNSQTINVRNYQSDFSYFIPNSARYRYLDVSLQHSYVTTFDCEKIFTQLTNCKYLKTIVLDCSFNKFSSFTIKEIGTVLKKFKHLHNLALLLGSNSLQDESIRQLSKIILGLNSKITNLRLDISYNPLSIADLLEIGTSIRNNPYLKALEIDLSGCKLNEIGGLEEFMEYFRDATNFISLSFILNSNFLHSGQITKILSPLYTLGKSLKTLSLSLKSNKITSVQAFISSDLRKFSSLRIFKLYLQGNSYAFTYSPLYEYVQRKMKLKVFEIDQNDQVDLIQVFQQFLPIKDI